MSIKRTKQYSRSSRFRDAEVEPASFTAKPPAQEYNWDQAVGAQPETSFVPYAFKTVFPKEALINHPVFGKGIVTAVEGKKIEVLFKDGKKKLAHAG
jgi:hypothetical protein